MRTKLPQLRTALDARFREHQAFLVSQALAHIDYLEEAIDVVSKRLDEALAPYQLAIDVLVSIPGIQRRTAEVVIAVASARHGPPAIYARSTGAFAAGADTKEP